MCRCRLKSGFLCASRFGMTSIKHGCQHISGSVRSVVPTQVPEIHTNSLIFLGMAKEKKVKVVSSKVAYRGPAFWVTTDHVVEPSGVRTRRDIVHHSGSVVILVADDSRPEPKVLLERQYRHAAEQYLWELPAGRKEKGEDELVAAKRELLEETGYSASKWKRILRFFASPGIPGGAYVGVSGPGFEKREGAARSGRSHLHALRAAFWRGAHD